MSNGSMLSYMQTHICYPQTCIRYMQTHICYPQTCICYPQTCICYPQTRICYLQISTCYMQISIVTRRLAFVTRRLLFVTCRVQKCSYNKFSKSLSSFHQVRRILPPQSIHLCYIRVLSSTRIGNSLCSRF